MRPGLSRWAQDFYCWAEVSRSILSISVWMNKCLVSKLKLSGPKSRKPMTNFVGWRSDSKTLPCRRRRLSRGFQKPIEPFIFRPTVLVWRCFVSKVCFHLFSGVFFSSNYVVHPGELQALEDLHMFHASKIHSDVFEYIYASEYQVIIPCRNYHPVTKEIEILRLPEMQTKCKDDFPRLTSFLLSAAREHIRRSDASTVRHVGNNAVDFCVFTEHISFETDRPKTCRFLVFN